MRSVLCITLAIIMTACGVAPTEPAPSATLATITPVETGPPGTSTATIAPTITTADCIPTIDDGLSPSYKPGAPIRSEVGHGHVLTGVVRSSVGCIPIENAQVELWPEYEGKGHPDEARATIFTDKDGRYRFECDPPEHIHMRISAPGFLTLAQNSYHPGDQAEGRFDIVLVPGSP